MELLTIGAFARAARLSPKALRLYGELGLLPPAAVSSESGYRFYHPGQLEQARLIGRLRRLGMPLDRIRTVIGLDPAAGAAEVAAYWAEVVAETAERGRLAAELIDHLAAGAPLWLRHAARTDRGRMRMSNEDAAYAGGRLLAVADGMRGAAGARASAAAIDALKASPAGEPLHALARAFERAERAVRDIGGDAVTTLTAMLWSGDRLGLVHIGDTRAYLLRDGDLRRITDDHTWVRSLVDDGLLSPDEARSHPQRALLTRAITTTGAYRPDLSLHEAVPGDRYLLCSDGLSTVVPEEAVLASLRRGGSPDEAVDELIGLAHEGGAPDNVACVVADLVVR